MQIIKFASALTMLTYARASGNVHAPRNAPATATAEPAGTPLPPPVGNVFETAKPSAQTKSHGLLRDEVFSPGNVLKVKTTKKPKTTKPKTTTSRATGNNTNAAAPMTVYPWRAAGVALGAALVVDALHN